MKTGIFFLKKSLISLLPSLPLYLASVWYQIDIAIELFIS